MISCKNTDSLVHTPFGRTYQLTNLVSSQIIYIYIYIYIKVKVERKSNNISNWISIILCYVSLVS